MRIYVGLWVFFFSGVSGCGFLDSADDKPAYLNVNSVALNTSELLISNSHNIKDAWVFADGVSLGINTIPFTIPVLISSSETEMILQAGVRNNGVLSNPIPYPFYKSIRYTETYESDVTVEKDLEFAYLDNVVFDFEESFESTNLFSKDEDNDSATSLNISNLESKDGQNSGRMNLTSDHSSMEVSTGAVFTVEGVAGSPAYLEFDYKNDINLLVGLVGVVGNQEFAEFKVLMTPRDEWTKIYIELSNELASTGLEGYRIIFGAQITDPELEEADVYIDNVRLVHF